MIHEIAHITEQQRTALRARLLARARVLAGEIAAGLHSGSLQHDAFDAVGDEEAEVRVSSVLRDTDELREIEEALARIERGAYGLCVDCGSAVPYVRLSAVPEAARCVRCENERERMQAAPSRL